MLEVKISEKQQVHVMTKCPGVVLVMGMGDEEGWRKRSVLRRSGN